MFDYFRSCRHFCFRLKVKLIMQLGAHQPYIKLWSMRYTEQRLAAFARHAAANCGR
jgi:hypothetical protein